MKRRKTLRNRRNVISILATVMSLAAAVFSFAGQATFSDAWAQDAQGIWHVRNSSGSHLSNAWICDDAVPSNQKNVWYLLDKNGDMVSAGFVKDGTGNYYSLETNHNGYFGMLRHESGVYDCNGQQVYLDLEQSHNGSFAAIKNADAIEKLRAIYGLTDVSEINNSNITYTSAIVGKGRTASVSGGFYSGGGSSSGAVTSAGKTVKEEKAVVGIRENVKEEKKQPGSVSDSTVNKKDQTESSETGGKVKNEEKAKDQEKRLAEEPSKKQENDEREAVKEGENPSEKEKVEQEQEQEEKKSELTDPEEEDNKEQTTAEAEVETESAEKSETTLKEEIEETPDSEQEEGSENEPEESRADEIVVPEELSFLLVPANVQLEPAKQAAVDAAIADFKSQYITSDMTDFDKEMTIIQWMVENIAYDYDNYLAHTIPLDSTTPYGGLVKHVAVCDGYARTFEAMATACGLTTRRLYTVVHSWNIICLDGDWYHVDVTWEDPTSGKGYGFGNLVNRYINLTDEEILKIHGQWFEVTPAGDGKFEKVPLCNGTKYGKAAVTEYLTH